MDLYFKTNQELEKLLGERFRQARLDTNMTQEQVAEKGGVSLTALKNLESGKGCTIATLVRALRAIEQLEAFERFLPPIEVSPLAVAKQLKQRQRAGRQHDKRD